MINLNRVCIILCFIVLSFFLETSGGATNEAINASPPAAADEKTSDSGVLPPALGEASQCERDPFWPIGYVPPSSRGGASGPAKPAGAEPGKKTLSREAGLSEILKIGGVVRKGGRFYATINGFTVQTGEVVTAVADGEIYMFIVEKIDFKKVQIRPVNNR